MASEYYIDQMLSPEAAQQLDKMVASAEKLLELQVKINNPSSGGTPSNPVKTKDFDAVAKAADNVTKSLQNLQVAEQSVTQSAIQNKTNMQALNAVYKLNAIVASENTTQLQKLYAQQELANRAAQEASVKYGFQSEQFISATKAATNYSSEITKLELATSKMKGSANSMYGATFSLTQIMRELPNFAISARIGFMSLSNNIPMLIDSFKILSQQIDKTTGKPIGAAGAFKEFAKSLLSFNTIAIVASTLLVLFGDDMVKFIGKLFSAKNAMVVFSTAQQAMIDQMSKMDNQTHTTVGKVMELGVAIDGYKRGIGSSDSVVKLYNETLGTHYGKLKNINDVLAAYPKYAQDFIDYTIRLNASMTLASKAGDQFLRSKTNETILSKFNPSDVKKVEDSMRLLTDRIRSGGGDVNQVLEDIKSKSYFAMNNLHGGFLDYKEDFTDVVKGLKGGEIIASSIANKWAATVAYNQLSKSAKEIFPGLTDKTTVHTAQKQFSEIYVAREYYDKLHGMLIRRQSELEESISKTTANGIVNSFETRLWAAQEYYDTSEKLAQHDKYIEIQNANEKYDKQIKDSRKNVERYKAGTDLYIKAQEQFNRNSLIIEENRNDDIAKINDKYAETEISNKKKLNQTLFQIDTDHYSDIVKGLEISEQEQNRIIERYRTERLSLYSGINTNGLSSIQKLISNQEVQINYDAEKSKYETQLSGLSLRLMAAKQGSEEYINIEREMYTAMANLQDASIKNELAKQQSKYALISEISSDSFKLIEEVTNGFYDRYYQKLNDEKDYYSKIESEKEQDIEDRVKAGLISESEGEKEKANLKIWAQGQQDALDAKEKQAKKTQFMIDKAMALAQIWINYSMAESAIVAAGAMAGIPTFGLGTAPYIASMKTLNLVSAIAGSALIAAQLIPYFKDGGTVDKDGVIGVGDGGKRELMITPKGDWYITPDTTTHVMAEKGTKIFPDAAKIDMLSLASISNTKGVDLSTIEQQMVGLRKDLSRQKPTRLSPVSTLEAIKYGNDFNIRKRGI